MRWRATPVRTSASRSPVGSASSRCGTRSSGPILTSSTERSAGEGLRLSPEQIFVLGAVSQYAGAVIAVNLFDDAAAATIGWFRVISAALVLAPFTMRGWRGWSRADYRTAAIFGSMTAGMNISFYI